MNKILEIGTIHFANSLELRPDIVSSEGRQIIAEIFGKEPSLRAGQGVPIIAIVVVGICDLVHDQLLLNLLLFY